MSTTLDPMLLIRAPKSVHQDPDLLEHLPSPRQEPNSLEKDPNFLEEDPMHTEEHSTILTKDSDVSWYRQACVEAVVDRGAAMLTRTSTKHHASHAMKAVVVSFDRMWPNGTVLTCAFLNADPSTAFKSNQQLKVRKVVTEWQKYANITFKFIENVAAATIRIAFDSETGSWSYVGREVSRIDDDKPTMNLGWIDGSSDSISDGETGVILHEFGHTLGLMHEHQSPVRGNKITLKESAVIEFYTSTQGWTAADVKAQIIDVYNEREVSNYSDVDLTSIMQYFMPPQLNEQNIRVEPNNRLSETDKAFMVINYPPFDDAEHGHPDPSKRALFEAALDTVRVVGDRKDTILKLYDAHNWTEVRYEFTRFCTDVRLNRKAASDSAGTPAPSHGVGSPEDIPDVCISEERSNLGPGAAKAVATVDADLWAPGYTITYSFIQLEDNATPYRKRRIRETYDYYSRKANIRFQENSYDPTNPLATNIRIYFGPIPVPNVPGWCKIGRQCIGYTQNQDLIAERGGDEHSSFVISPIGVPPDPPSTQPLIQRDARTLYHEIGHSLGLRHEHNSPYTQTTDWKDPDVSAVTMYDDKSVMLYPGRPYQKSYAKAGTTGYNCEPSTVDIAFLGVLYPHRKGHANDRFEENLRDLNLQDSFIALDQLRNAAFAADDIVVFGQRIRQYRLALKERLAIAAHRAVVQPSRAIVPPSNFKAAKDAAIAPPSKATTGSFLDELVKTLQAFFQPTTGQLFALQFPGRFLQKDLYAWDTNTAGIYGQFVKPTVVNESEFRLVDQLYNVGTVVGAPNGINLSMVYDSTTLFLQSEIRKWLLKGVPTSGWVKDLISSQHSQVNKESSSSGPAGAAHAIKASSAVNPGIKPQFAVADRLSKDDKVNRMELADALMQEYLAAKQAWELERDDMILKADTKDLNALTRKLAHITAIREAQLASKHADAVVRGYSHTIRQYLGFLDVKTPGELLQDAKDALRESAVSSLDGSMKIYPVQMSPVDWFQSLSTSFTMEDLTVNADVIAQQIDIKSKQLDVLNTRLAFLQGKPKTNLKELQDKLDVAQAAYDRAQADLSTTYTSNVTSLAKTFIDADNKFQSEEFKAEAKKRKIADAALENIQAGMDRLTATQLSVTQNSRALALLMSQKSLAEASDTTQETVETNVQITALTKDIAELTTRLKTLRYSPSTSPKPDPTKPTSVNDIDLHPPTSSSGGSRWQELYMKHVVQNKYTASSDTAQSSNSKTDVSLFFGSYHSDNSQTSSSSLSVSSAQSVEVEVGFRATMVTVDRGGWFQPQFFKQSNAFHSIDPNITWSKWPEAIKTIKDLTGDSGKSFTELNSHLLPAYPVGFVVCKDITIRIHMSTTDIQSAGTEMEKFAASSAGVLCWSTSSSEHEKSSDKSYSFVQKSDGCVIRIPGPQILGYMLQFTDNDETTPIPNKLPDGFLLSDEDYDSSFKTSEPSKSVNPTTADPQRKSEPAKSVNPTITDPHCKCPCQPANTDDATTANPKPNPTPAPKQ